MQIKLHHRNTIRRLAVGDISYGDLVARASDLFGLRPEAVVLKYVDDEDDLVTFSTDGELADALRLAQGLDGPLKIAVLEQQAPRAAAGGGRRGWRGPCGPFGGFGPFGHLQHIAAQLEPVIGQIDVAPFVRLAVNLDDAAVQAGLPELVATASEAVGKVLAAAEAAQTEAKEAKEAEAAKAAEEAEEAAAKAAADKAEKAAADKAEKAAADKAKAGAIAKAAAISKAAAERAERVAADKAKAAAAKAAAARAGKAAADKVKAAKAAEEAAAPPTSTSPTPSSEADADWHKVTPPATATEEALEFLAEMGYTNTSLNSYLLRRFHGSIPRVVQELASQ